MCQGTHMMSECNMRKSNFSFKNVDPEDLCLAARSLLSSKHFMGAIFQIILLRYKPYTHFKTCSQQKENLVIIKGGIYTKIVADKNSLLQQRLSG